MNKKLIYPDKYWEFTRKVLLELKKQQSHPLQDYLGGDAIQYNVYLMVNQIIPIEEFGRY